MCLYQCRLLGGFSDSQSWAQHSEIKKQSQKNAGRVNAGFWENRRIPRGLGALLWRPMQTGGQNAQPQSQRTHRPHRHPAYRGGGCLKEQHCAAHWRLEVLMPTPPLIPQVHLPHRCAPANQCQSPSPDPAQTTHRHQFVGPQRMHRFSCAWKVGYSFLCTLCFIVIYFPWFFLLIDLF